MGSPSIFSGRRTKLLTADGLLLSNGSKVDNDGAQNFITNGHAEVNTDGWATYADAAGTRPVDGTGGSVNITWTRTTTTPLVGQASFLFTKDAANRQGQGVAFAFSTNTSDQACVLTINARYMVNSGTFVAGTTGPSATDSDLIFYLYDITNAALIEPSSFRLLSNSSTISDTFSASFQTPSNSTSFRLIIHCATTSASAYSLKFDDIIISRSQYVYGTPITDWQTFTPTGTWVAYTTYTGRYRRVGDSVQVTNWITLSGAPTATGLYVNLPSGLTIDTAKLPSSAGVATTTNVDASGKTFNAGSNVTNLTGIYNNTTSVGVAYESTSTGQLTLVAHNAPFTYAASMTISFDYRVPITGWSSSVQMSDSTDTRVVAAKVTTSSARTVNNTSPTIVYETVVLDTHGAYNSSTGEYTVRVPGAYKISGGFALTGVATTVGHANILRIFKNAALDTDLAATMAQTTTAVSLRAYGSAMMNLVTGDVLTFRFYADTANTLNSGAGAVSNHVSIERISGPSAIAASESVVVAAGNSSGQSIASSGSGTTVTNWTKDEDTHQAFNATTGVFTAPIAGLYEATAMITFSDTVAASDRNVVLRKGTAAIASNFRPYNTTGSGITAQNVSYIRRLASGETIDVQVSQISGSNQSLSGVANRNTLTIKRIGL